MSGCVAVTASDASTLPAGCWGASDWSVLLPKSAFLSLIWSESKALGSSAPTWGRFSSVFASLLLPSSPSSTFSTVDDFETDSARRCLLVSVSPSHGKIAPFCNVTNVENTHSLWIPPYPFASAFYFQWRWFSSFPLECWSQTLHFPLHPSNTKSPPSQASPLWPPPENVQNEGGRCSVIKL